MRALTLTQPWAGLVAAGIKRIENRPRPIIKLQDFGKPFAIHASREIDEDVYARIRALDLTLFTEAQYARWYNLTRITSAVIGVATVDRELATASGLRRQQDIIDLGYQERWFFGPVGYVLRDNVAIADPVPCRGWQGFWTLDGDIAERVTAQLGDPR